MRKIAHLIAEIASKKIFFFPVIIIILLLIFWTIKFNIQENGNSINVKSGPIIESVYGLGTIVPTHSYQIKIGVVSNIKKLFVKEGDLVKAGQPLIELEQIALFKAPFSGTITSIPFKIGETVFPQIPILTLMDLKDRYITVSLEQQGALRIKKNQKVRIIFESMKDKRFIGNVRAIFPTDNQFTVHIDAKDLPDEILPGMTADVAIEIDKRENAILIPLSSVASGVVQIIRKGKKMNIEVKIGVIDGEFGEVVSGDIQPTDKILLSKLK
ncbi:MAG: efflux RND transporter periplasmic adaptor subunit [Leptospiraceae bacterium]|nr:efflux RND transporter periplasmic adaptor subunit [Leptospiraceae bacterium]